MFEASNQQRETTVQMDDTVGGVNLNAPHMDDGQSVEIPSGPAFFLRILAVFCCCSDNKKSVTVPRRAGNLAGEIEEFILAMRRHYSNTSISGRELSQETEKSFRMQLPVWNTFLQLKQGVPGTSAIISSDINKDMNMFITRKEEQRGETLVTGFNLFLTVVGFILYLVDLVSDIATAIYFASNGQWWQAIVTLAIVYTAVIIHTGIKWQTALIHCTGAADWLRYVASLLINWPDLKQYGALCRLEWQLYKSPTSNARLVREWDESRFKVALLKFSEGVWEACPQAILQLCLLVPDLYGTWTWTDYLRIAGASVSLCTAGAALVNMEQFKRISIYIDLPLSELVVLHVWAVPVTVSRLVSVALFLIVHPYWALVGVALHLVLHDVYWCKTEGVPRELEDVISMCMNNLQFCMSPFDVADSIKYRRVSHAIHLLGNSAATVVWALGTPLVCAHPALYTAIICFNAVMFAVGLVGWQLHEKHWRHSYFIQPNG